jgi:hypothetical protein
VVFFLNIKKLWLFNFGRIKINGSLNKILNHFLLKNLNNHTTLVKMIVLWLSFLKFLILIMTLLNLIKGSFGEGLNSVL